MTIFLLVYLPTIVILFLKIILKINYLNLISQRASAPIVKMANER
jgi:hypothetical protein